MLSIGMNHRHEDGSKKIMDEVSNFHFLDVSVRSTLHPERSFVFSMKTTRKLPRFINDFSTAKMMITIGYIEWSVLSVSIFTSIGLKMLKVILVLKVFFCRRWTSNSFDYYNSNLRCHICHFVCCSEVHDFNDVTNEIVNFSNDV